MKINIFKVFLGILYYIIKHVSIQMSFQDGLPKLFCLKKKYLLDLNVDGRRRQSHRRRRYLGSLCFHKNVELTKREHETVIHAHVDEKRISIHLGQSMIYMANKV